MRIGIAIGSPHGLKYPYQHRINLFGACEAVHAYRRVPKRVKGIGLQHAKTVQVKQSQANGQAI
jgi:hypothetical protein